MKNRYNSKKIKCTLKEDADISVTSVKQLNKLKSKQEFNNRLKISSFFSSFSFAFFTMLITSLTLKTASIFTPFIITTISVLGSFALGSLVLGKIDIPNNNGQDFNYVSSVILNHFDEDNNEVGYSKVELPEPEVIIEEKEETTIEDEKENSVSNI